MLSLQQVLPGSGEVAQTMYTHVIKERKIVRERKLSLPIRALIPTWGPTLMMSSNPKLPPRSITVKYNHIGI
jgi:hypothetical protein